MALPLRPTSLRTLAEADPHWIGARDGSGRWIGMTFECPIHDNCRLGVAFSNPVGGGDPEPFHIGNPIWLRQGEDLLTLTISPSIHVQGGTNQCEWHGFIVGGVFQTCGDSR